MTTSEAFLQSLDDTAVKARYPESTIRTWRSRVKRDKLSLDFMVAFLIENGYQALQTMQWTKLENDGGESAAAAHALQSEREETGKAKDELGKKLFGLRKEMNSELLEQWFVWCKNEYAIDYPNRKHKFTEAVFAQITYGRYISKDHILFALKALKQGKHMVQEFEAHLERELQNL